VTVHIPSPLRSYTAQRAEADVAGSTLEEVLTALDQRYPGLRFRIITEQDTIRRHIKIFVNETLAPHLNVPLRPNDQVYIICALSGGS
jgi:molybdopterin converting factor small subunit